MRTTPTIKQERFAYLYVETGCASDAYRTAYAADAMAPRTVHTEAARLVRHPRVAPLIERLRAERLAEYRAELRGELVTRHV